MWKFQSPSWKDSPTRYATRRKIRKVELSLGYNTSTGRGGSVTLIFGQDLTCRYLQPAGVIVLPGGHAGFAVGFAGG